jgi:5'-deoxynucleotidase YfbR-like HD superfamily hydrolase
VTPDGPTWIRTYTGRKFSLVAPRAEDVAIEDIARHLSMLCRYTGGVRRFYSVAEHSVRVAAVVTSRLHAAGKAGPEYGNVLRWALLHDAAEAYCGDLSRPLKYLPGLAGYRDVERAVMAAVAEALGLVGPEPALVRAVDKEIIGSEARVLKFGEALATVDPLPDMMPELRDERLGMEPAHAERAFLGFWELVNRPGEMPRARA